MTLEGKDYNSIARGLQTLMLGVEVTDGSQDVITATAGYNKVNTVIDENQEQTDLL